MITTLFLTIAAAALLNAARLTLARWNVAGATRRLVAKVAPKARRVTFA